MSDNRPFRDDLELAAYADEPEAVPAVDDPDAPLPLGNLGEEPSDSRALARRQQPRWLQRPQRWFSRFHNNMTRLQPRWLDQPKSPWTEQIVKILRPRLTVGYIIFAIIALYVLYCYIVWSPFFASKLPKYTGPHDVGAIEVEVPVRDPRNIVDGILKADGRPAFQLDTVLFTIYYPAVKNARSSQPRHKWIPPPISLTAEGYATAAHFNNFFSRGLFTAVLWGLASSIEIPAKVDVPILKGGGDGEQFPVVVLSHGDVSSGTDYTMYCGELASRGYVVAAIDHRDGSCPGSLVHLPNGETKKVILFRADQLRSEEPDKVMSNDDWRFKKLAFRDAEIEEVIDVLQRLNEGDGDDIHNENYLGEGQHLADWQNRLDFSQLVIAGHSFGATGAMQALRSARKSTTAKAAYHNPAIGGIILDPGKDSGRLNTDIDVPLLIVHSDSWSKAHTIFYGRPHFDTVRDIALDVLKRCGATWFMTSLKTSHPSVTDAPLIEPLLLSWTTGATISVKEGLREYVRVSTEFLQFCKDSSRTGVLDVGVTHESYGNDTRTEEQKKSIDTEMMKYWEVHVAPPSSGSS